MVNGLAIVTVVGSDSYFEGARACVRTLLSRTDLDVFVGCDDPERLALPSSSRLHVRKIEVISVQGRPDPFLAKFRSITVALAEYAPHVVLVIDVDAVICRRLTAADLEEALDSHDFGMAEQSGIAGSTMGRAEFLDHYVRHALVVIDPDCEPPTAAAFRYFNSGVVIARPAPLVDLSRFALSRSQDSSNSHLVGEHMVADQDYFQYWVINRNPGTCAELSTDWNHSQWWDADFPRALARVRHYSNFCMGPDSAGLAAMKAVAVSPGMTAVVVAHESAKTLGQCLASLRRVGIERIVVLDNASTDTSVAVARAHGCDVISSETNLGFAAGVNEAQWRVDTEYVCIVNPDVELDERTLGAAVDLLDAEPRCLVVPDFVDSAGHLTPGRQPGYSRRKIVMDVLENNRGLARYLQWVKALPGYHARSWHWPIGACLFMRTMDFAASGGFDTGYFVYMEDVDFGRRWQRAGGRIATTGTTVLHESSTGSDVSVSQRIALLNTARMRFAKLHYGRPTFRATAWAARQEAVR